MKELIKVETNEQGQKLVSGRELHEVLKIQKPFTDWIPVQLKNVDAIENEDYTKVHFKVTLSKTGQTSHDYILTLDIAKEICMCVGVAPRTNEETRKLSKQVRKYFIECEKQLLQQNTPSYLIEDSIKRAERWIEEERQRRLLLETNEELIHKNKKQAEDIQHKNQVILGLTRETPKPEVRKRINQIIRYGAKNGYAQRYNLAYNEFNLTHGVNVKARLSNAIEKGLAKPKTNRLEYICDHMGMTWELYEVVVRVFEGDLRQLSLEVLEYTSREEY